MTLERQQSSAFGFLQERSVERVARQGEWNIHPRTCVFGHRISVETGTIDVRIKQVGLGAIALGHRRESALFFYPLEDERREIPAECVRRVEHRILRGLFGVARSEERRVGK